ncbi:MAG: hypothetical protein ABJC09_04410, partial [Terriglobia bacterium]
MRWRAGLLFFFIAVVLAAASPPVFSVPSYKGMDYGWGSNVFGTPTYEHWLTDSYDPVTITRDLDAMARAGTLTTTAWLFLDRCIVKDSTWGTSAYTPAFYPDCTAHWEDFLAQLRLHHMGAIVNLLNRGGDIGSSTGSIERAALAPQALDSSLLGPGVNNGDMSRTAAGFPVGWQSIGPGQASLLGPGNGLTSSGFYLSVSAGPSAAQSVRTPSAPFDGGKLVAISVPVRGKILGVSVLYLAADGSLLSQDDWSVGNDFGDVWQLLRMGSSDAGVLPSGVASIAVQINVPAGGSGFVGPVQVGNGLRNGLWQSYRAAVAAWISRYSGATDGGKAILGWQAVDEGYEGISWGDNWGAIAPSFLHSLYVDLYQVIRGVPSAQPVGIESANKGLPLWSQDAAGQLPNKKFYADAADYYNLHLFDDTGSIPPGVDMFDKPWLIGEAGASLTGSPAHFSDPTQQFEPNAISKFLTGADSA